MGTALAIDADDSDTNLFVWASLASEFIRLGSSGREAGDRRGGHAKGSLQKITARSVHSDAPFHPK